MNLIGIIPGFESPTMTPAVPAGLAVCTFFYYNWCGLARTWRRSVIWRISQVPMPWLAPLMIPIEFISHLARPLSLTIRLFANMFAGEKVTMTFLIPHLSGNAGRLHGTARIRGIFTGLYLHAADDDLCQRRQWRTNIKRHYPFRA